MKRLITALLLATSFLLLSSISNAGTLDPDCTTKKTGKNAAMKATVGVGGRCSSADAAKDSARGVTGFDDKGKNKNNDKNPLKKNDSSTKSALKKVLK